MAIDTDRAGRNSTLAFFARVAMLFATVICLPIAGWYMSRLVAAADKITEKVDKSSVEIQLLQQSVTHGFETARGEIGSLRLQLSDHEGRIRTIERDVLGRPIIR